MNIKRKTKVSESREEMDSPEFASPVKTKKKNSVVFLKHFENFKDIIA